MKFIAAMASRGRRGGAPAREDEPRREERAEQQAPTLQGPVLPPLPPVDYGVFMQGLVQDMQTQAHTQAALQAQLEAQTQQRLVAVGSTQVHSVRSPSVKKECPYCGKTHGGSECWMVAGKCLKCGSSHHRIKDCPRLQQGVQRGVSAPVVVAAVAPATRRPGRPRAPARVFALAREDAEPAEHVTEGTPKFRHWNPYSILRSNSGFLARNLLKFYVNPADPVR
ncbi:hypothetical protein Taro_026410 [Colocasia esculenta]|uniref:CCHC-type domain-containing protein n=1 Tax=Colocasia esculenta TaxID=4460 RepID=A0A843VBC1_COLES|nr:hypothetical protein [Colocasia esculenta]